MEELGIGIVGCGYWGINHVRVFTELPESRVVAVCDLRQERLREVGQRFAQVAVTTDLDELIGRQDVDAVVICTAAASHYDIASICLQAGKHVLLEKPITTNVADAEDLIRQADS
ncbi:MAG: Gfo/Idh/MocA family oxidoreductase, partial [Chloroflexota bacterium]